MTKRALITGITGQDGSYLAELQGVDAGLDRAGLVGRHLLEEAVVGQRVGEVLKIGVGFGDVVDGGWMGIGVLGGEELLQGGGVVLALRGGQTGHKVPSSVVLGVRGRGA